MAIRNLLPFVQNKSERDSERRGNGVSAGRYGRRARKVRRRPLYERLGSLLLVFSLMVALVASWGTLPLMPEAASGPVRWKNNYRGVTIDLDGRELWKAAEEAMEAEPLEPEALRSLLNNSEVRGDLADRFLGRTDLRPVALPAEVTELLEAGGLADLQAFIAPLTLKERRNLAATRSSLAAAGPSGLIEETGSTAGEPRAATASSLRRRINENALLTGAETLYLVPVNKTTAVLDFTISISGMKVLERSVSAGAGSVTDAAATRGSLSSHTSENRPASEGSLPQPDFADTGSALVCPVSLADVFVRYDAEAEDGTTATVIARKDASFREKDPEGGIGGVIDKAVRFFRHDKVQLSITKIKEDSAAYMEAAEKLARKGVMDREGFFAYDISFGRGGREYEPEKGDIINVTLRVESLPENASSVAVQHFTEGQYDGTGEETRVEPVAGTTRIVQPAAESEAEASSEGMEASSGAAASIDYTEKSLQRGERALKDDVNTVRSRTKTARALRAAKSRAAQEAMPAEKAAKIRLEESDGIVRMEDGAAEASFVVDGFSLFTVTYTVDFTYELNGKRYEFRLPGGGFLSLKALIEALGIAGDAEALAEKISSVEFSSPELLSVSRVTEDTSVGAIKDALGLACEYSSELTDAQIGEINATAVEAGDWALISLKAFDTEETLTVTLENGAVFTIRVTDAQIRKTVIDAKGDTWEITVSYGEEAEIPEGAELDVEEILPEDARYDEYFRRSLETADPDDGLPELKHAAGAYAHIFDITIRAGEKAIEPAAPVSVSIRLMDAPEDSGEDLRVVHFGAEGAEVMETENRGDAEAAGTELSFSTDEFSVYAVVSSNNTNVYGLGGLKAAIINANVNEAVLARTNDRGRLAASTATTQTVNGKDYVFADEATIWEFESVNGSVYHIKAPDGRYMNISGQGTAQLSANPQNITVSRNGYGLRLTGANGYSLNAWNNNAADGFGGGDWNNGSEGFTLYTVDEIIHDQADKISLTNLVNQYRNQNPVRDVIIYTRIINEERDGYNYYAVASDGSLVPVYDIGDIIGWTSSTETSDHLKWKFTVHTSENQPNGYFDFQSVETGQYLIPTDEGGIRTDDPEDPWDLGINMPGWVSDGTGRYGSELERWDNASRKYIGYAYDSATNRIVPTADEERKIEFLFAFDKEDPAPDQLHEVATLDGKTKGITIRMYDFDGRNLYQTHPPRSQEMTQVMGSNSISSTNINGVGYANRGLVSETLNDAGFPRATQTNRWLSDLFSDGHLKSDASNIFVRQVYDETGYYSYDSSTNYAWLDQANNKFVLYRELAAPSMEDTYLPGSLGGGLNPSANKGNFFPFNSLQDLADRNYVFEDRSVQFDGDLNRISPENPQYGQKLYRIDQGTNYSSYYFGMTMEADFYQGADGKDDRGNDIIYEFNGDDDMWLYIDDRLILDIGGCHGAVSGTINFCTGEVHVNGSANQVRTTLREIFMNAGKLPDGSNWTEAGAAEWFRGDTFADYTKHSFKMFYMERGAYASNLKMRFNLLTLEQGTFILEKKLPADVQSAYGDQLFAYQIFTMKNGEETLYTPPAGKYVTYESTGERVLPEGETQSRGYQPTWTKDGITYSNVYLLSAGESITIPMENNDVQYYVREIGIPELFTEVKANNRELTITEDRTARIAMDRVKNRGRVVYENIPKETHSLRLEKLIDGPVISDDDSFRFDVQFEDGKTGQMVPFSRGKYYVVQTDAEGVDHYFKYEGGKLVPSSEPVAYTAGLSGSIDHIFPGYTFLITGLLPGTDFKVTESTASGEYPAGYEFVKKEVEHAGASVISGADGTILPKTEGETYEDALVKITNTSDVKFSFTKIWRNMLGTNTYTWPSDKPITVVIKQDDGEYASYTIRPGDVTAGAEIAATGDAAGEKQKLKVETAEQSGYVFKLEGLTYGHTYAVSEETVDGYQAPKYFLGGTEQTGATQVGDGGVIENLPEAYELPSAGGPGTYINWILGTALLAVALMRAAAAGARARRR